MFKSILNPSETVAIGVAIGAVDVFIFNSHLPAMADIRTASPQNTDIDAARRQATGLCIAVNGLVSLMTRDWNVFLIGGIVTVGLSVLAVHANSVYPETGTTKAPGEQSAQSPDDSYSTHPLPDYGYGTGDDESQAA